MKKTVLLVGAMAFLSLLAFTQDEEYYSGSFVRMTYVKGDVVVNRAGDLGSETAVANLAIVEGDQLESRGGRAEVSFGRKNYLRVDNDSLVEFSLLPKRGDDRVRIHLLSGSIYLRISQLQEEKSFEIHTPDASFYVLEDGLYRLDAQANGETELSVLEGSMEAAGEGGSQLIGSRERIIAANGQLGSQSNISYTRDDFDNFNADREAIQTRYASKRYLPSELDDYESELADNGYWAYERPYGYVWVPYVHAYADWRPYYYGYWNWYPLCGWSWIPYEPWGWGVYHYGRWGWRLGLGWYWIPHHRWGPAWVHWYWGHDYWGWSPLSWYNYPCVIVNNHFYDRYHGGYYPGGNHAMTIVRKDQLQNRHISRVALSRSDASRLGNITMRAQQPDVKPVLRSSQLRKAGSSKTMSIQPQIRPSSLSRSQTAPAKSSSPQLRNPPQLRNSSLGQSRTVSGERPQGQGSRVSSGSLSRSRSITPYPPSGSSSTSSRQIRSLQPSVKNKTSSPGLSSSDRTGAVGRNSSPKVYAPNSNISRYGTSAGRSSVRSQSSRPTGYGESRSISRSPSSSSSLRTYRSSPSVSRPSSSFSSGMRSNSGSSSSRSVFSAPRSYPSPRSYSRTSPSVSRSLPNFSSGSRSYSGSSSRSIFSAPRSSSPSRSFSHSSPSRSFSSGSRPSSSSRSYSSPSRSSSSPSRSSSSGSVRRKN
jgi:hypothetical protein